MEDKKVKTRKYLEENGVTYSKVDGFNYNGCPSDFGLENDNRVCHPSGDGCEECQTNAFEEIWFGEETEEMNIMNRALWKAKRVDNGKWVVGYYSKELDGTHNILCNDGYTCDEIKMASYVRVNPSTLCQCSGLKDKNDILIFEGDNLTIYEVSSGVFGNEDNLTEKTFTTTVVMDLCDFVIDEDGDGLYYNLSSIDDNSCVWASSYCEVEVTSNIHDKGNVDND